MKKTADGYQETIGGVVVSFEKTSASYRAPGQRHAYKTAQWVALAADGRLLADGCATRSEALDNARLALRVA